MNKNYLYNIGFFMMVIVILFILSVVVRAENYSSLHPKWNNTRVVSFTRWTDFVNFVDKQTNSEDPFTEVAKVDKLVRDNIEHKFYWNKRNLREVWKSRKGDCTDKARSICYFLNNQDIECRLVHGTADGTLHDWYEYRVNNTWYSNESQYFDRLKRRGTGSW